jgi:hypothetical protein
MLGNFSFQDLDHLRGFHLGSLLSGIEGSGL